MSVEKAVPEFGETLADLLDRLGGVPLDRIRLVPPPGTATEDDVIAVRRTPERWLVELVERTLILKPPSLLHSVLSGYVCYAVLRFLKDRELGIGIGASAMIRLRPGLVRIPDFAYFPWSCFPGGRIPNVEIADFVPSLVVELPHAGHTEKEIERKVVEYFDAGVRLVWLVHYSKRSATVYRSLSESFQVREDESLEGDDILPGFSLSLAEIFRSLEKQPKGR